MQPGLFPVRVGFVVELALPEFGMVVMVVKYRIWGLGRLIKKRESETENKMSLSLKQNSQL